MISNLTPSPYNQDSNIKLNKDSNINKICEEYWINKLKTQNKIINPIVDNNYKNYKYNESDKNIDLKSKFSEDLFSPNSDIKEQFENNKEKAHDTCIDHALNCKQCYSYIKNIIDKDRRRHNFDNIILSIIIGFTIMVLYLY